MKRKWIVLIAIALMVLTTVMFPPLAYRVVVVSLMDIGDAVVKLMQPAPGCAARPFDDIGGLHTIYVQVSYQTDGICFPEYDCKNSQKHNDAVPLPPILEDASVLAAFREFFIRQNDYYSRNEIYMGGVRYSSCPLPNMQIIKNTKEFDQHVHSLKRNEAAIMIDARSVVVADQPFFILALRSYSSPSYDDVSFWKGPWLMSVSANSSDWAEVLSKKMQLRNIATP